MSSDTEGVNPAWISLCDRLMAQVRFLSTFTDQSETVKGLGVEMAH
jgi:hypothetical protein